MSPSPPRDTVQLTDQALVAVHLARGAAQDRPANAAHVVVGLLGEPDGVAGRRIRRIAHGEPAVRLSTHPGCHAPGLPKLSQILLALPLTDVPAWTDDLLAAATRTGGQELRDLLADTGLDMAVRTPSGDDPLDLLEDGGETFGRGTFRVRGFDALSDEALARARAVSATSESLLPLLPLDTDQRTALDRLPRVALKRVVDRALDAGGDTVTLKDLTTAVLSLSVEELRLRAN